MDLVFVAATMYLLDRVFYITVICVVHNYIDIMCLWLKLTFSVKIC